MPPSVPRTPTSTVLQASVVRGCYRREGEPRHDTEGYRRDREALAWPNASLTSPSPATCPLFCSFLSSQRRARGRVRSVLRHRRRAASEPRHAAHQHGGFRARREARRRVGAVGRPKCPRRQDHRWVGGGIGMRYVLRHARVRTHTMTTAMLGLPARPTTSPRPTAALVTLPLAMSRNSFPL